MKHFFGLLFLLFATHCYTQSEEVFTKKGKILVETGTSILSASSQTVGVNFTSDFDSRSTMNLGFNLGYFLSENFALKLVFNTNRLLKRNEIFKLYDTDIMLGAKYYLFGKFPIQIIGGRQFSSAYGISYPLNEPSNFELVESKYNQWAGGINVGYAFKLADNIYLEPYFGRIIRKSNNTFTGGFSFAMFLGKGK